MALDFDIESNEIDLLDDNQIIPKDTPAPKEPDAPAAPVAPTVDVLETPDAPLIEDDDEDVDPEFFQKLSTDLFEMGIFTRMNDDESISSPEELAQKWAWEKEQGANQIITNFLGQYGPEYSEAFDAVFVKGLNPYEYFSKAKEIDDLENIDLEDEDAQKYVFRNYWSSQGFTNEQIESKLRKTMEFGELAEDTKDLHSLLINKQRQHLQESANKRQYELQQEQRREDEFLHSVHGLLSEKVKEQEFDGIPLSIQDAQLAMDFMTVPRWEYQNKPITDMEKFWIELKRPENYAMAVKFALLASKGFNVGNIEQKLESKKANKLFTNLTIKNKQEDRNLPKQGQRNSFFD